MATPRSSRGPVYRFRGHHEPTANSRTPILRSSNEVPEPAVDETVATLRLYDPVDDWGGYWGVSASEFAAALDAVPDTVTEIHLHINSPGGIIFEGITILNLLRQHSARVVAIVDGVAASIASVIAVGADEVVMNPDTVLMIHDGAGFCAGTADDMREVADVLDLLSDTIAGVYSRKAGGEVADWRETMKGTAWYTPQQALEAGLIDRIAETPEREEGEGEAAARARAHRAAIDALADDQRPPVLAEDTAPAEDRSDRDRSLRDEARHRHLAALLS